MRLQTMEIATIRATQETEIATETDSLDLTPHKSKRMLVGLQIICEHETVHFSR